MAPFPIPGGEPDDAETALAPSDLAASAPNTPRPAGLSPAALASVLDLARRRAPELSVPDLADHAGYSPFHFSRLFTLSTGLTPGQHLTALRMATAKELLLLGEDAVIDVAVATGYDSLSSFTRRFRESVGVAPGALRRLADRVADRAPRPFALLGEDPRQVRVRLSVPADERGDPLIWVGWFPRPAPIGLPTTGMLVQGRESVDIPLHPGAPWLLGFAVAPTADVLDHLAPPQPMVAAHPRPLHGPSRLTLHFSRQMAGPVPLLAALPALCRG